jgi:hypothetical protein
MWARIEERLRFRKGAPAKSPAARTCSHKHARRGFLFNKI